MRFNITTFGEVTGKIVSMEVIGDPVTLPNTGDEVFAVHNNIAPRLEDIKTSFVVSHVETGFRIAIGNSIDAAIDAAEKKMSSVTPEFFRERIAMALLARDEQFTQGDKE